MKFELHVTDNDVSNGSIAISWCLDKDALDHLKQLNIKNPVVVLCVAPAEDNAYDSRKELRKVVPLKDLIAYVDFRRAGKNNIWGFVCEEMNGAKNKWLAKDGGSYDSDILSNCGDDYRQDRYVLSSYHPYTSNKKYLYLSGRNILFSKDNENVDEYEKLKSKYLCSEPVSVYVPKECFAPEPSDFEKAWVNHFFNTKAVDQCNFRRRRMFAYSVQPFIMAVNIFLRIFCLFIAALLGSRSCSFKSILHPLRYDIKNSIEMMLLFDGTIFVKKPGQRYVFSDFIALPFMPAIVLALYGLTRIHVFKYIVFIAVLVAAIFVAVCILQYVLKAIEEKQELMAPWYADEPDVIVCGELKPRKLSNLPTKYKTIRLRYQDLKAKICRPFSV